MTTEQRLAYLVEVLILNALRDKGFKEDEINLIMDRISSSTNGNELNLLLRSGK